MRIELEDLGKLEEIFQQLLSGYHISNEDFGLYHDLQQKESTYEALFAALGYSLQSDVRGFYYFEPDSQFALNATTRKMALIVFVVAELLADEGRDPYAAIMKGSFDIPVLAVRLQEKQPDLFNQAGMPTPEAVEKFVMNSFVKYGFATVNANLLRFRAPVGRFLDVCVQLGRNKNEDAEEALAESNNDEE